MASTGPSQGQGFTRDLYEDTTDGTAYAELRNPAEQASNIVDNTQRRIDLNRSDIQDSSPFKSNSISTTKYTFLTFWPKFLFEQFRKAPNAFFFVVALLQQIPGLSPTGRFTTAVPLSIIMLLTVVKELIEDLGRLRTDSRVNNSSTRLLRHATWQKAKWKEIEVGDIVQVEANQLLPADIMLLSSSEPNGICYIETANLDGETNLKVRQSLPATANLLQPNQFLAMQGCLLCDLPNDDTLQFKGSLLLHGDRHSVSLNQLLMRGTCLRKTKHVTGLVVYTGPDTKVMKNSKPVPLKRSRVEVESNKYFLLLLALLMSFTAFTAIAHLIWTASFGNNVWYIPYSDLSLSGFGSILITAFIVFHTIVPISLQVTLEFMRIMQAYFIQCDLELYDESTDIAAEARTSSLNEELGQINFVFSDKTGTLTQNSMVFQCATVAGEKFGDVSVAPPGGTAKVSCGLEEIRSAVATGPSNELHQFLSVLTVCHTVIPEKEADGRVVDYSASSPDESALVLAAASAGYQLYNRNLDTQVTVRVNGEDHHYEILAFFEFSSDRKRMSMVVRCPDKRVRVFVKGADSIIFSLVAGNQYKESTAAHLHQFAEAGLRTLCIAYAEIGDSEWQQLNTEYCNARNDVNRREEKVAIVAAKVERNLSLLGATAIEDKLQVGVPATINDLLLAGMRLWVLTGDKLETAVNIGRACRLLQPQMTVLQLIGNSLDLVRESLQQLLARVAELEADASQCELALIIEGETLAFAGSDELRSDFMDACLVCRTVICCRVSPKQKSDVVRFVREALPAAVTLAIGDGANDVPMIQESHVGIGIKGKEGLQAAAASDYSFGQFRFLKKLLFVHGAWSYYRVTIVILFSFYKNIALYCTSLWFAMVSGYSGQVMFEKWTQGLYNVFFTGATPFALGLFDRPCPQDACMRYPQLYGQGQDPPPCSMPGACFAGCGVRLRSVRYNFRVFVYWMLNGLLHSIVIFFSTALVVGNGVMFANGQSGGVYVMGSIVYTLAVLTVAMKAGLEHTAWTWLSHLAIWGSLSAYCIFFWISSNLYPHVGENFEEVVGFDRQILGSLTFWCLLLLVPIMALTFDITVKACSRTGCKTMREDVMEMEAAAKQSNGPTERARLLGRFFRRHRQQQDQQQQQEQRRRRMSSVGANYAAGAALSDPANERNQVNDTGYAFEQDERSQVTNEDLLKSTCGQND